MDRTKECACRHVLARATESPSLDRYGHGSRADSATVIDSIREMVAAEEITPAHALSLAQRCCERAAYLSSVGIHSAAAEQASLAADLYDWVMGRKEVK